MSLCHWGVVRKQVVACVALSTPIAPATTVPCCCGCCLQELPDVRSLHLQTQQLQVELQDLERQKRYKAAEVQTTKENIKGAEVGNPRPGGHGYAAHGMFLKPLETALLGANTVAKYSWVFFG